MELNYYSSVVIRLWVSFLLSNKGSFFSEKIIKQNVLIALINPSTWKIMDSLRKHAESKIEIKIYFGLYLMKIRF